VRSNTRGVYKSDDDDQWVANHAEIQRIAGAIEARRIELGKTSGFERLYARVTELYFGGMARHFADLRTVLKPGAHLAYVVGDQASYLRVMIRTGQILADIGQSLGYEVVSIDLFRTRMATATKEQLREEVVVFRWPGTQSSSGIQRPAEYFPDRRLESLRYHRKEGEQFIRNRYDRQMMTPPRPCCNVVVAAPAHLSAATGLVASVRSLAFPVLPCASARDIPRAVG